MVLVAVSNGNPAQFRQPVLDVADVWDDQVDSALPLLGEFATGVEQDEIVAIFDRQHALADFADSAKRNDAKSPFGAL